MAAVCVQAIWIASAPSISSFGAAASIMASAAFKAISEIPLYGNRAAACSWNKETLTKALEGVPSALLSLFHHSLVSPSGGYGFA